MHRPATLARPRHPLVLLSTALLAVLGCSTAADGREGPSDGGTAGVGGSAGAGGQGGNAPVGAVSLVFAHGENLYGALVDSPGETRRLSDIQGSEDQLAHFEVSPDGRFVAYLASRRDPECCRQQLMVTSLGRIAEPVRIDEPPGSIERVEDDFAWSPDAARLAYRAYQSEGAFLSGDLQVFTSQPDGNNKTQVSADGIDVSNSPNGAIAWSPDGSRIAYPGYERPLLRSVLHTNAWSGDSNRQVAGKLTFDFKWRSDGAVIAYAARNSEDIIALFTNDAMGASETEISAPLHQTGVESYAWSPDGSRIAYMSESEDGIVGLYSRAADGSDERDMTGELQWTGVLEFQWSFDGSRLAYLATQDREDQWDLYTTEADGSGNTRISSAPEDKSIGSFHWSPTGDWIAFEVSSIADGANSVFVSAGSGSLRRKLNLPGREARMGYGNEETPWSPNGEHLAFHEWNEIGNTALVTNRRDGNERRVVWEELEIRGRGVSGDYRWSPDSERIAYRADKDEPNLLELYTGARDGSDNQKVSMPGFEAATGFQWVP